METAIADVTWQQDLTTHARRVSTAVVAGLSMGALVGGIGGRIAMFVLRVTSDASLHGAETDDGFIIGQISGATLFLVIATSVLGVFGGIFYLAVRSWLPERWRAALFGVFGGIVGGAGAIRPDGIDFTLLDPLPLAIAMFIALPAIYGVVVSRLIERWLREDSGPGASQAWTLGLIPLMVLAFLGPVGIGVAVVHARALDRAPDGATGREPLGIAGGRLDRESGPDRGDRGRPDVTGQRHHADRLSADRGTPLRGGLTQTIDAGQSADELPA